MSGKGRGDDPVGEVNTCLSDCRRCKEVNWIRTPEDMECGKYCVLRMVRIVRCGGSTSEEFGV